MLTQCSSWLPCCSAGFIVCLSLTLESLSVPRGDIPWLNQNWYNGALRTWSSLPTEAHIALQPSQPASPKVQLRKCCSGQCVVSTFVLRQQGHKFGCCVTWPLCPAKSQYGVGVLWLEHT